MIRHACIQTMNAAAGFNMLRLTGYATVCSSCLKRLQRRYYRTTVQLHNQSRLVEVGKLEPSLTNEHYQPGQLFIHRVFGYRGVLLFSWMACVYDRDTYGTGNGDQSAWEVSSVNSEKMKGFKPELRPYYKALIDRGDFPFIRKHPEAVTYLANPKDTTLYSIPGLDYVSHDDVIPYSNTSKEPFNHELFHQFFVPSGEREGPSFVARELLNMWKQKNQPWLEQAEVHRETTHGVRVTVIPFYMGHIESQQSKIYRWRYYIRIENHSGKRIQLKERQWRIYSVASGTLETVQGVGVVGEEPVFTPEQPAFQYSSHVSLPSHSGHMWGTFRMENTEHQSFEVRIPPFSLESPDSKAVSQK